VIQPVAETNPLKPNPSLDPRLTHRQAAARQLDRRVIKRRHAPHQMKRLKNEPDALATIPRTITVRQRGEIQLVEQDLARVRCKDRRGEQQ
jgi:hypothetical protein